MDGLLRGGSYVHQLFFAFGVSVCAGWRLHEVIGGGINIGNAIFGSN